MVTRRRGRLLRRTVIVLIAQCTSVAAHLRGDGTADPAFETEGSSEHDGSVHLQGSSAYDDDWHVGDVEESGGDQDMISQYSKYGAKALPAEPTWTDRVIPLMERDRRAETARYEEEEEDSSEDGPEIIKAVAPSVERPFIPYNTSVVNTSGYLNRSWADIQKHYGPGMNLWDRTRLGIKRVLDFSRNGASNCINAGGGEVPLYEYCEGCDMQEAQYCLWDMRYNLSGNVRFGCEMDHITNGPQPKCCAQYGNVNDQWTVMGTTSAIGDAMLCLRNVGCEKTEYYTSLEEECVFNTCNTLYVNEKAPEDTALWPVIGSEPRMSLVFKRAGVGINGYPFSHHDFTKTYEDLMSATKDIIEYEKDGESVLPIYYKNGCMDHRGLNAFEASKLEPPLTDDQIPIPEKRVQYWKRDSGINWQWDWRWNKKGREVSGNNGEHPKVNDQNVNLVKQRAITEDWGGNNLLDDTANSGDCGASGCQIRKKKVVTSESREVEMKNRNWADDEVRKARELHDWRKLFLGWDAKRNDVALDDDKYDDDIMIGRASSKYWKVRGTFEQFKGNDRDTRIEKRPARCKSCYPSVRTANVKEVNPCFSGLSTILLESGLRKPFSELQVGDRILSADASGKRSFDEVVFLPHGRNSIKSDFISLTSGSGKQVHATPVHLFRTCDGGLATASALHPGSCIQTADGNETVTSSAIIVNSDAGIYTAILAENEFLVVDGFVASPFATAPIGHWALHRLYNLHRVLYWLMPAMMKNLPAAVVTANSVIGTALGLALDAYLAKPAASAIG